MKSWSSKIIMRLEGTSPKFISDDVRTAMPDLFDGHCLNNFPNFSYCFPVLLAGLAR